MVRHTQLIVVLYSPVHDFHVGIDRRWCHDALELVRGDEFFHLIYNTVVGNGDVVFTVGFLVNKVDRHAHVLVDIVLYGLELAGHGRCERRLHQVVDKLCQYIGSLREERVEVLSQMSNVVVAAGVIAVEVNQV